MQLLSAYVLCSNPLLPLDGLDQHNTNKENYEKKQFWKYILYSIHHEQIQFFPL